MSLDLHTCNQCGSLNDSRTCSYCDSLEYAVPHRKGFACSKCNTWNKIFNHNGYCGSKTPQCYKCNEVLPEMAYKERGSRPHHYVLPIKKRKRFMLPLVFRNGDSVKLVDK